MPASRTRVLVVDDSALMRQLLTQILSSAPDLEVVGSAGDPIQAWQRVQALNPDVLTLDVEMPRMDGVTFLERLMHARPLPVVMVSSLTERGADITLRALEAGAIDFVTKPKIDVQSGTVAQATELVSKVRAAARARPRTRLPVAAIVAKPVVAAPVGRIQINTTHKVIVIGASTGGTEALREVLAKFPADCPGTVIVQHMPEHFTRAFADRLNHLCAPTVREATHGAAIIPGQVLIAPGNRHMRVVRSGAEFQVALSDEAPVRHHRPAVDVLMESAARTLGANAVGVILTGMGDDGARGLLTMYQAGAHTIGQDENSSVVYGMPKEAFLIGAVKEQLPLSRVADTALAKARRA